MLNFLATFGLMFIGIIGLMMLIGLLLWLIDLGFRHPLVGFTSAVALLSLLLTVTYLYDH